MNRSNWLKQDDEPTAERVDERSSGIRARGARPPLEKGPCTTFEEVHARYKRVVRLRILEKLHSDPSGVEDVHQEVLICLNRRIREHGGVPQPVWPLLASLIEGALKDHLRGIKRRRIDGEPDEATPTSKPNPEQLHDRAEDRAALKQEREAIFAAMDARDAELIMLAHHHGVELSLIAEIVGKKVGAVGVALHRARARFRELYEQHHGPWRKP